MQIPSHTQLKKSTKGSEIAPNAATNPSIIPSKICAPASIISLESPIALKFFIISSKYDFVSSQLKQFSIISENLIFCICLAKFSNPTLIGIETVVSPSNPCDLCEIDNFFLIDSFSSSIFFFISSLFCHKNFPMCIPTFTETPISVIVRFPFVRVKRAVPSTSEVNNAFSIVSSVLSLKENPIVPNAIVRATPFILIPFPVSIPSILQAAFIKTDANDPDFNARIVIIVSGERFFKNSFNPLKISSKLSSSKKPTTNSQNPSTHPFIASAHCFHLNFRKNLLNPDAKFRPNCLNLNLSVNPFEAKTAVLSAPAITSAVAVNTLFPFLSLEKRPFKNDAKFFPKSFALLYREFQGIFPIVSVIFERIVSPRPSQLPASMAFLISSARFFIPLSIGTSSNISETPPPPPEPPEPPEPLPESFELITFSSLKDCN